MAAPAPAIEPQSPEERQIVRHWVVRMLRRMWQSIFAFFKQRLVGPLVAGVISVLFIGRIIGLVSGPSAYQVYVIGALSDPQSAQIDERFGNQLSRIAGVPVEVHRIDDLGDGDNAQRISMEVAARNDSLMVIGHMYSTQTQRALPAYLQAADPPIPVILTTETNPAILPVNSSSVRYDPVFRLSPTDDSQAETAADFIGTHGGKNIWVVEDRINPVYSKYLARAFVEQIHRGKFSAKVVLWSTNYSIPPAYAISDLNVNWVFFAGDWHDGLVLVHQLKALKNPPSPISVLMTDWAVDDRLLPEDSPNVRIYLTHPLSADTYSAHHYGAFGADAHAVVDQLLRDADQRFVELAGREGGFGYRLRRLLGIRRVSDARRALSQAMQNAVLQRRAFKLPDGTTSFGANGVRTDAAFHVWQIKDGKFANPD